MDLLYTGPEDAPATLLLAHGAGAAMDSAWMNDFCARLAKRGVRTARFEFGYMAGRRVGENKPPPKAETLIGEYEAAVKAAAGASRLYIGGKSMGGRVASFIADRLYKAGTISGLICLGYPFHPPGRPDQLRTAHLLDIAVPTLICHGTRDPFASREEVQTYPLASAIRMHWLEDGDHDLTPRKAISGRTKAQNLDEAADAAARFMGVEVGLSTA